LKEPLSRLDNEKARIFSLVEEAQSVIEAADLL